MQGHAAVFREQSNLEAGCEKVMEVCKSFADVGITDRSMVWNTDLVETLELENLLTQGADLVHALAGGLRRLKGMAVILVHRRRLL